MKKKPVERAIEIVLGKEFMVSNLEKTTAGVKTLKSENNSSRFKPTRNAPMRRLTLIKESNKSIARKWVQSKVNKDFKHSVSLKKRRNTEIKLDYVLEKRGESYPFNNDNRLSSLKVIDARDIVSKYFLSKLLSPSSHIR